MFQVAQVLFVDDQERNITGAADICLTFKTRPRHDIRTSSKEPHVPRVVEGNGCSPAQLFVAQDERTHTGRNGTYCRDVCRKAPVMELLTG